MREPQARLWNKDNSDVLPEFQLTYGHGLFRGLPANDWRSKLFRSLKLDKATYIGPIQQAAIPRDSDEGWRILGSVSEIHLLLARLGDVSCIFGPHDLFFRSQKWMDFNNKVGGLFALVTQMDMNSFFYDLFKDGVKQTNALAEGTHVRIIPDTPIKAYLGGQKIYEDKSACSLSDSEIHDFIKHDLLVQLVTDQLVLVPRFLETTESVQDVMHFIFRRSLPKKSFFGTRLG